MLLLYVSMLVGSAEVGGVKEELRSAKVELKEVKEENRRLEDEMEKERCEKLTVVLTSTC